MTADGRGAAVGWPEPWWRVHRRRCEDMASAHTLARSALLKRARLAAGLTQEELAARSGVSVHTISDLERGLARHTRASTLALLADVLSLGADELACIEDAARGRDTPSTPAPGRGSAPQDPATD